MHSRDSGLFFRTFLNFSELSLVEIAWPSFSPTRTVTLQIAVPLHSYPTGDSEFPDSESPPVCVPVLGCRPDHVGLSDSVQPARIQEIISGVET